MPWALPGSSPAMTADGAGEYAHVSSRSILGSRPGGSACGVAGGAGGCRQSAGAELLAVGTALRRRAAALRQLLGIGQAQLALQPEGVRVLELRAHHREHRPYP